MTIHADRWKSLKFPLISAAFVVGGFFMLRDPNVRLMAIGAILFFGVMALMGLASLVVPSKLVLDDEGLTWKGLRSWRVGWSDVERFRLETYRGTSTVYFDYRDTKPLSVGARRVKRPRSLPVAVLHGTSAEIFSVLQEGLARARAADPVFAPSLAEATPVPIVALKVVFPWLSVGIIAVLCLVFAAEIRWPVAPSIKAWQPSTMTLAAFGALGRTLVEEGQWYRLATAPFLHGSLTHLLFNGVALFLAGRFLEGYVGRPWFGAIYVVGALTGGVGSLLWNQPTTVSVGASGAIVALFAAMCVCSLHLPPSRSRNRLQSRAIGILLPTLLSLGKTGDGLTIDFGAHLGGAVGGALVGLALVKGWSRESERPPRQRLGLAISFLGLFVALASGWPALNTYARFQKSALLIPASIVPKSDDAFMKQAPDLLTRYPGDPRAHLAMALLLMKQGDAANAEAQARIGLSDPSILHDFFDARTEASLWMVLGEALVARKDAKDALDAYDRSTATDRTLPGAFYFRAQLFLARGDLDAAWRDAEHFAALVPDVADAWSFKGDILFAQGKMADAVAAYDTALRLDPSNMVRRSRGLARFFTGDASGGIVDLQGAVSNGPSDLYAALWLDIVQRRVGHASELRQKTLDQGGPSWPAPVVSLYLGTITPEELSRLSAAGKADLKGQMCEAGFYTAEWTLMRGQAGLARDGFEKAARDCPPDFVETWMAKAELKGTARP